MFLFGKNKEENSEQEKVNSLLLNVKQYKANDILYKQGEKSSDLYVLNYGKVAVYVDDTFITEISEKGAIIGESSLLLEETRSATIKVIEDSEFMVIPGEYIDKVIIENPSIGINLLKILIKRLRNTTKQVVYLQRRLWEYEQKIKDLEHEKEDTEDFRLGQLFYKSGIITREQLKECEKIQEDYGKKGIKKNFGEILIERGYATVFQVMQVLKIQKELKNIGSDADN